MPTVAELRARADELDLKLPSRMRKAEIEAAIAERETPLTVVAAVGRDLETIAELAPDLARGSLAASALALARELDSDNSATSKSMCARALIDTMDRLRELAPERQEEDGIDDLEAKRAARQAARGAQGAAA